ncbi:MAG: zinc ribbon domain-containing protein [Endomicrobia bacterium]|nr:zinc ribbon domain-containing protein [Endomicrobiia bacterium]
MPVYEYICKKCNTEFELLLFSGEEPVCPKCGSKELLKKISLVSFCTDSINTSSNLSSGSSSCSTCSSKSCSSCK